MTEIQIDLQRLKAVALAAAKNDVRYYLNGVCVEATKDETMLLASQGHIAAIMRHCNPAGIYNVTSEHVEFIIPNELIDRIKLSKSVSNIGTVLIRQNFTDNPKDGGDPVYTLRLWDGTLMPFQPIAGQFPDIRRVYPATVSGEAANLNPDYLGTFRKIATALGVSKTISGVWVQFNGDGPSRVILEKQPDFAGLLMPVRDKNGEVAAMPPMEIPPRGMPKTVAEAA